MSLRAKGQGGLWTGCLGAFLLLAGPQGAEAAEGAPGSRPLHVITICILPFYTSMSGPYLDADLAPLLEADLSRQPWLEVIPTKTVYEVCYSVQPQPWLVNGQWERGVGPADAEVYVGLRERLLPRARARFPADYYVMSRVISTGVRETVVVEVMEKGARREAVFRSSEQAETAEQIPEAIERVASEIVSFLEPGWSIRNLEEIRKQYLARLCSLASAVRKAEEQVDAHPGILSLRVLLLSLYEEDVATYAAQAADTAARIVDGWDTCDRQVTGLVEKLEVDPFLVLCREQAKAGSPSGADACRLGMEKYPLRAAEYEKLWLQKQKDGSLEGKKTP